ncbi:hypothetical protein LOZ58_006474 [Ophidiomyces ophidiicola]|nr:hypothetical protein LOZ58_006474 [Ophidiomyces ophidiicola]
MALNSSPTVKVGETAPESFQVPIPSYDGSCMIIASDGDIILNCTVICAVDQSKRSTYRFRITSASLIHSSTYFGVLLDPTKFQEGRRFLKTLEGLRVKYGSLEAAIREACIDELPQFTLELPPLPSKFNQPSLLRTFFQLLVPISWDSTQTRAFCKIIANKSITFVACLAVLADRYGTLHTLKKAIDVGQRNSELVNPDYRTPQKHKLGQRLRTLRTDDEERIREAIFLAYSLQDQKAFGFLTHRLVVTGSRKWRQVYHGQNTISTLPIWWHLPGGVEEELQFRNQCILGTISDYQSYLLCSYGASRSFCGNAAYLPLPSKRELQCRRVYENSRACDSFHLGEMIHFFTTRTHTLELQSTLTYGELDYYSDKDSGQQGNAFIEEQSTPSKHPVLTNITTVIASLRQCPEYQIDSNHIGCGIRRRLIAVLDRIEGFTKGCEAVGICLDHHLQAQHVSWTSSTLRTPQPGEDECDCHCSMAKALAARAFFTATHRVWQ